MHLFRKAAVLALALSLSSLLCATQLDPSLAQREKMARDTRETLKYLRDYHYLRLDPEKVDPAVIIRQFVSDIDPHRMLLTQNEINSITSHYKNSLQSAYLSRGDLYPAFDIYNRYQKDAQQRLDWVQKRLQKPFDFTRMERFAPDRSNAQWPKNQREADALWEDRLTFEVLGELLNTSDIDQARQKITKRYQRNQRILNEFDAKDLESTFLTAIAETYDPHSNFFSADTLEDFSISMSNKLVGIGAMLKDEDGTCVIQELIPGGPAENSGLLHIGDKILEVAQKGKDPVDVVDMRINKIVNLIRGQEGTDVILTVETPAGVSHKITLTRAEVRLSEGLACARVVEVPDELTHSTTSIGVIDLPSFYAGTEDTATTTEDLKELIGKLDGMGIKGLVLDLRRNGGGLLSEAIGVVGLFVPSAPVVQVRSGNGNVQVRWDRDKEVFYGGPLVVLTSRLSASASEIVAGALQALDRAIVVGDSSTHGKGTVQAIFDTNHNLLSQFLPQTPSGAVKITIQKFYLPDGASTQNKGVLSDIALPSINDVLPIGESDIPHALPWDHISTARWSYRDGWDNVERLDKKTRQYLIERSQQRQKTLPEFDYLNKLVEHTKMRYEQKQKWLNYDLRLREKNQDEKFKQASEQRRLELSQNRYASADVLLDISWNLKAEHQSRLQSTPLPDGRARAGAAYENIYYHQSGDEIREILAGSIDYEAIGAYSDQLAQATGLSSDQIAQLLTLFEQADERAEFNINEIFEKALPQDFSQQKRDEIIQKFFEALISIDPALADDHPALDIPLREALRTAADWAGLKTSNIFNPAQQKVLAGI